jgi:hypothetical protein
MNPNQDRGEPNQYGTGSGTQQMTLIYTARSAKFGKRIKKKIKSR